ncbi:putative prophage phiRv2 integrase [Mycobacterium gallinarum]|uniref:Prophage phiRv2 integrase n=1 Tax=Mycobacterium gallinarum TaxID=39689 RepID=A0A9W4FE19_9MYCO|nr:site-specific integrase [Mycobacterium gallinarum]BBY91313.1 putative prophage phiRv2 integrase [Mycobacterium gallinarum]
MPPKKKAPPRSTKRSFGRLRQFRSGRWKASYTGPDGVLYEAPATFALKLDAEAWLTDRRREIDRELWSPPGKEQQPRRQRAVTFAEYAERWLETRTVKGRPLRPRTREHYRKLLDEHLVPAFGTTPLRAITPEAVDRWYAKTSNDAPTLRAHMYSLLRTILESARTDRDRLIEVNPCMIRGAATAQRKSQTRPASLAELDTIVAAMPERFHAMVLLASWCALRFGELVELRRRDVDLGHRVVRVRRAAVRVDGGWQVGDPKSDAGRREVAIPPHIVPVLEHHLTKHTDVQQDSLLFPADNGNHLQPSTLYRHFYKARAAAKRDDLRWHDLRHSGAVLAAQTGATLAELMARLGHSTVGAAMRYQHAAQGRDQAIAAALSKLVEGQGE